MRIGKDPNHQKGPYADVALKPSVETIRSRGKVAGSSLAWEKISPSQAMHIELVRKKMTMG